MLECEHIEREVYIVTEENKRRSRQWIITN